MIHVGFARVIWTEYIAGYFITECPPSKSAEAAEVGDEGKCSVAGSRMADRMPCSTPVGSLWFGGRNLA